MPEDLQASIQVEWIETDEEPFRPEAATTIFADLEPLEADETTFFPPTYVDFFNSQILPPFIAYEKLPQFEAATRELIINIETTGSLPWESRLVVIGVLDPNALAPEVMSFIEATEEETINSFLRWFEATQFDTLSAYNVAFDYRFIYAVLQKYRLTNRRWPAMQLYDLMQQQKQVKNAFVPGFNKPGTLEQWSTYLFGTMPYAPQKQLFKWYEEGNVEEIVNFNSDKIVKAYGLWVLNKVVDGTIPGAEVLARPSTTQSETQPGQLSGAGAASETTIPVSCPNCLQGQSMPKTAKVIDCVVCGTPIAHP